MVTFERKVAGVHLVFGSAPRVLFTSGTGVFALLFLAFSSWRRPLAGGIVVNHVLTVIRSFGLPGRLVVALFSFPIGTLPFHMIGRPDWHVVAQVDGSAATVALLLMGAAMGRTRERNRCLLRQIDGVQAREACFHNAFSDAPIGMALVNPAGRLIQSNRALADLLGYSAYELSGLTIDDLTYPEDRAGRETVGMRELRLLRKGGVPIWIQLYRRSTLGPDGRTRQTLLQVVDISVRREAQDRLVHAAYHDALTGLANRRLFDLRLHGATEQAQRHSTLLGVLFLDLDGFKRVNDTWGHALGDRLLQVVAGRLRACVRAEDTVARWEAMSS